MYVFGLFASTSVDGFFFLLLLDLSHRLDFFCSASTLMGIFVVSRKTYKAKCIEFRSK